MSQQHLDARVLPKSPLAGLTRKLEFGLTLGCSLNWFGTHPRYIVKRKNPSPEQSPLSVIICVIGWGIWICIICIQFCLCKITLAPPQKKVGCGVLPKEERNWGNRDSARTRWFLICDLWTLLSSPTTSKLGNKKMIFLLSLRLHLLSEWFLPVCGHCWRQYHFLQWCSHWGTS